MDLNKVEEKLEGAMRMAGLNAPSEDSARRESMRLERLGWDELTVEQKIERMRKIVKGIDISSSGHWRRLEELDGRMRQHVHDSIGRSMMPRDAKRGGIGVVSEARMPHEKVYF